MGNFCTNCGRPLQEGEVCNCTQQNTAGQAAPQPIAPDQTANEISRGFANLVTALKCIWTNPAKATAALAHSDSWLPALILIAAQALFSAFFALTNFGVGIGADGLEFLVGTFFFTFFSSLVLAGASMGMYLGIGKAVKGEVTLKSALATTSIRCFVCLPLTFIGMLLGMANVGMGLFLFLLGEIVAILLSMLAVQETFKLNPNRTFIVVGSTYLAIFILFVMAVSIFCGINLASVFGYSSFYGSSWY